jgi:hypothetical protein
MSEEPRNPELEPPIPYDPDAGPLSGATADPVSEEPA